MSPEPSGESVLLPTPWCTIREQEDKYLVYNSRTDELHLLPPTGFYAYSLCDGLRTVDEVQEALAKAVAAEPERLRRSLRTFFGGLIERGMLEVADEP
jgi:hypothetical protein